MAEMTEQRYRVVVSHDDTYWVADVPELPGAHTQARNLVRLDDAIREVIALVEDLPEGAESDLDLEYEYEGLDDVASAAAVVGRIRSELDRTQARLSDLTTDLVRLLVDRDWSVRDIAPLLHISPGRVSQLSNAVAAEAGGDQLRKVLDFLAAINRERTPTRAMDVIWDSTEITVPLGPKGSLVAPHVDA
jgi:predicted RNase H-like HicB family nuclease